MISLYQAFASIKNEKEFNAFMADLCTGTEIRELNARWRIAQMLWRSASEKSTGLGHAEVKTKKGAPRSKIGLTQRDIANSTGFAIATITRVSKCLFENTDNGYRNILSKRSPKNGKK
jgi:uncharacterized protein YerC